mgnify:CR=1 FL=1
MTEAQSFLTPEKFAELKKELEHLSDELVKLDESKKFAKEVKRDPLLLK